MANDIIEFPKKGAKHGADRVRNSRNDSSHVFLSVPELVEEIIREGMNQRESDSQQEQEQDLIEIEQSREAVQLARDFLETLRRRKFCHEAWVAAAAHISENWNA